MGRKSIRVEIINEIKTENYVFFCELRDSFIFLCLSTSRVSISLILIASKIIHNLFNL